MSSIYSSRHDLTLTTKKLLSTVLALVATTAIAGTAPQVPANAAPEAGSGTVPKAEAPQQRAGAGINGIHLGMTSAEVQAAQQPGPFLDPIITYDNDRVIAIQGTLLRDERPLGVPDNSAAQQLLRSLEKSPGRLNRSRDQLDDAINTRLGYGGEGRMLLSSGEESLFLAWYHSRLKLLLVSTSARAQYDDLTDPVKIRAREAKQRSDQHKAEVIAAAKEAADKQAKALEESKLAEAKRLERKRVLMAGISGPMLCNINGKSKPTLYLDLGVNNEFKLVTDGTTAVTGKWRSGSFQGLAAILLVPPASPKDSFPDLYTAYEDSIKIAQNSISLTLARRSTFPGSGSAEAYEAACTKAKPLTLEQAMRLTSANQKNNPLRPEVITQRQQEKAYRPSDAHCTRLEDTFADRPALQKRLLAQMGCN